MVFLESSLEQIGHFLTLSPGIPYGRTDISEAEREGNLMSGGVFDKEVVCCCKYYI